MQATPMVKFLSQPGHLLVPPTTPRPKLHMRSRSEIPTTETNVTIDDLVDRSAPSPPMQTVFYCERQLPNSTTPQLVPITNQHLVHFLQEASTLARRLITTRRAVISSAHALGIPGQRSSQYEEVERSRVDYEGLHPLEKIVGTLLEKLPLELCSSFVIESDGETREHDTTRSYISHQLVRLGAICKSLSSESYPLHLFQASVVIAHEWQHRLRYILAGRFGVPRSTPPKVRVKVAEAVGRIENDGGLVILTGEGGWNWEMEVIGGRIMPDILHDDEALFNNEFEAPQLIDLSEKKICRRRELDLEDITDIYQGADGWEGLLPFPPPDVEFKPDFVIDTPFAQIPSIAARSRQSVRRIPGHGGCSYRRAKSRELERVSLEFEMLKHDHSQ